MEPMMWFVTLGGLLVSLVLGWMIDLVFPGAGLLGFNLQGLVFNSLCMIAMVWLAVRLELFD
jgi:hypothetical protein